MKRTAPAVSDSVPRTVTFPTAVHDRIEVLAQRQRRSFSNTVVWLAEQALAQLEAEPPPG